MSATRVTVEILGEQYSVRCSPSAQGKLHKAASELAALCERVQQGGKSIARERVLVVAALNLAAQLYDFKRDQDTYSERMQLLNEKVDIIE